jgi:FAD/FMN-containing dehydrogenase
MPGVRGIAKSRREFIKKSAMAGGMLAFLNERSQTIRSLKSPIDPDAIRILRKSLGGVAIVPGDTEYEKARRVRDINPETDKYPAIVLQCKNEEDVLRGIEFACQHKLEVAVRSGNHSMLGWGTCEKGIVIDLSQMKSITVDPVKKTALASAGCTAEEILSATAPHGLAPALGECGSVGAGLLLGGGLGFLSGKYGATCDNLVSARVVTADARTLKTDRATNQDLFWAIRGGGGNFGVATSFEHELHPVSEILAGSLVYPSSKARAMLRFFREFMSSAPDELQADCYLNSHGNGSFAVELVFSGALDRGEQLLNKFRRFSTPDQDSVKRRAYGDVYNVDADFDTTSFPFQSGEGSYIEQLSDEVIDLILDRFAQPPPSCELFFIFGHYMHGEVCRVAPDATAFELRKADAVHLGFYVQWKDPASASACMSWNHNTTELLKPNSGGRIYANYMSAKGAAATKAVYGSNYARLSQLKKRYDPQNIFHLNQNVQPD